MTFHSRITAASPLALATAFNPLLLDRGGGSAVVTIRKALEELPVEVQDSTLELIELQERLEAFAATAHRLLSPSYYLAFVRWAQAAAHANAADYESDAEGALRASAYAFELERLARVAEKQTLNPHEAMLHFMVMHLDSSDDDPIFWPLFGPRPPAGFTEVHPLLSGLVSASPVLEAFNDVALATWAGDEDGLCIPGAISAHLVEFFEREKSGAWRRGGDGLLKDFQTYQLSRATHMSLPEHASDRECAAALKPSDIAFDRMIGRKADTFEGVLAKLRVGFSGCSDDAWVDDAVVDPDSDRFRAGLELADCYTRMIYSGIEDLAAIAGVPIAGVPADKHLATVTPAGGGAPIAVLGQAL